MTAHVAVRAMDDSDRTVDANLLRRQESLGRSTGSERTPGSIRRF